MSTEPISARVAERAHDLVNRVVITSSSTALVASDSGAVYTVSATFSGLRCSCPARVRCAHVLAAAARWAER
jgi:SWIM zinc finger